MGDVNHSSDSNTCEAGHKAVTRTVPKDGSNYSTTRSFPQRVAMVMAEANSPHPPPQKFLVHADILARLTGRRGFHSCRALERRSQRDAANASGRQTPAARLRRQLKRYRDSNTKPPPRPPPPPPPSPPPPPPSAARPQRPEPPRVRAAAPTTRVARAPRSAGPAPAMRGGRKRPAPPTPTSPAVVAAVAACAARRTSSRARRGDPPKYS